jgi:hypothetical protein
MGLGLPSARAPPPPMEQRAQYRALAATGHFRWKAHESGEHLRDHELAEDRLVVSSGSTTSPQA